MMNKRVASAGRIRGLPKPPFAFRYTKGKSIVFSLFISGFYGRERELKEKERETAILYGALGTTRGTCRGTVFLETNSGACFLVVYHLPTFLVVMTNTVHKMTEVSLK